MNGITIRAVQTANQTGVDVDVFDPFRDALTLVMRLTVDDEVIDRGDWSSFEAVFQIIDPARESVVVNSIMREGFRWSSFWISKGRNWGPASGWTTAERWGLDWGWYRDLSGNASVFGFRGIFKAYYGEGGSGSLSTEDFAVSEIKWFRLKEIYRL
ncbi:MAG: hypothetical protein GTO18_11065 [Anaerolineales bacterium]|nr:hypothetical protein [Anaerolineales bacterium]